MYKQYLIPRYRLSVILFLLLYNFTSRGQTRVVEKPTVSQGQTGKMISDSKIAEHEITDSIRVQPALKTQVQNGLHQLGSDIHDAFTTLKSQVKEANKTSKSIFEAHANERDSAVGLNSSDGSPVDSTSNEVQQESRNVKFGLLQLHKHITKLYSISKANKLYINNKFGNIKVVSWDQPQMKVDILIIANGPSKEKLNDLLNLITIEESKDFNQISLITHMGDQIETTWNNLSGKNKSSNYEVNYLISMPKKNSLSISARYGRISLPDNITVIQ